MKPFMHGMKNIRDIRKEPDRVISLGNRWPCGIQERTYLLSMTHRFVHVLVVKKNLYYYGDGEKVKI